MTKRIWELDVFRGICILAMVLLHLLYDLQHLFGLLSGENAVLSFVMDWGGVLFFLLSGICVTLGRHPIRRGSAVLACGAAVSAVLWELIALGFLDSRMMVYFGVLHCLGACMLLWPIFRRLPWPILFLFGAVFTAVGLSLTKKVFPTGIWLVPLGLMPPGFVSADYFPLLPFLGFFLLGAVLGRTLYKNRTTLFPNANTANPLICFFSRIGTWSLPIYLLHQPVITGILTLLEAVL